MKVRWLLIAALSAALIAGCSEKEGAAPTESSGGYESRGQKQSAGEEPEVAQKICPVMGGEINKEIYVDHEGRRVYFCCEACIPKFKENPDKYLKKLDEQLKAQAVKAGSDE